MMQTIVFIIVITVGLFGIALGIARAVDVMKCNAQFGDVGETKVTMLGGCMVNYKGAWWPADKLRPGE